MTYATDINPPPPPALTFFRIFTEFFSRSAHDRLGSLTIKYENCLMTDRQVPSSTQVPTSDAITLAVAVRTVAGLTNSAPDAPLSLIPRQNYGRQVTGHRMAAAEFYKFLPSQWGQPRGWGQGDGDGFPGSPAPAGRAGPAAPRNLRGQGRSLEGGCLPGAAAGGRT